MTRWLITAGALLAAACGYSTGLVLPESDATVGIEFFGNESKEPDVEQDLQTHVTDAMNRMVQAPLVSPGDADLVVRGTVLSYRNRGGIRNTDNELLESGLMIAVEAQLVRRSRNPDGTRAERVLGKRVFQSQSGFRFADPVGEQAARARVLRNIADRVVLDLFGPLAYEAAQ